MNLLLSAGALLAPVLQNGTTAAIVPLDSLEKDKPNIILYMTEDLCPHLYDLYPQYNENKGAKSPTLEKLAKEGVVYNNAYSNAAVSSAARSTLITGCYAPKMALDFHRGINKMNCPQGARMFPSYLREKGYFTVNASKTDYNCVLDTTAWNNIRGKIGDWNKRKNKSQPFFFCRTNAVTHESCLHFPIEDLKCHPTKTSSEDVFIFPNLPDTPLMRYTFARLYDRILDSDNELGRIVKQLKEEEELENTFIIYVGDNGGDVPGTKGYTYETGLQVPLIVYIPEKYREKFSIKVGTRNDKLVSFMDLGPTILKIAGIDTPSEMDGKAFMGEKDGVKEQDHKDCIFGYSERYDELYAFYRTVRKGRYKYSRNFLPFEPRGLYTFYRYRQLAFQQWRNYYYQGLLNEEQSRFFEEPGPEELYDVVNDPYELHNLAYDSSYMQQLKDLREVVVENMKQQNDLGVFPEHVLLHESCGYPVSYGEKSHNRIASLIEIANFQMKEFSTIHKSLFKTLSSDDLVKQYWGVIDCIYFKKEIEKNPAYISCIRALMKSKPCVASKAALLMALYGKIQVIETYKKLLLKAESVAETLLILNDMTYLKETLGVHFKLRKRDVNFATHLIPERIKYLQ